MDQPLLTLFDSISRSSWLELYDSKEDILLLLLKESFSVELVMALAMVTTGAFVCVILLFFPAPYGRYAEGCSTLFGPGVPVRMAWLIQESPAFLLPVLFLVLLSQFTSIVIPSVSLPNAILLGLFLLHYFQRSFIYSLLIPRGKSTPFVPFFLAFTFCSYNGVMQMLSLVFGDQHPHHYLFTSRFLLGVSLFLFGLFINIHSDHILRNLRQPGETGYKIPAGGMFEFVTTANYFGETLEWFGFAFAASTPAALAFFAFTVLNLAPRALSHHQWYLKKFENYPKKRKAYIPFIL